MMCLRLQGKAHDVFAYKATGNMWIEPGAPADSLVKPHRLERGLIV